MSTVLTKDQIKQGLDYLRTKTVKGDNVGHISGNIFAAPEYAIGELLVIGVSDNKGDSRWRLKDDFFKYTTEELDAMYDELVTTYCNARLEVGLEAIKDDFKCDYTVMDISAPGSNYETKAVMISNLDNTIDLHALKLYLGELYEDFSFVQTDKVIMVTLSFDRFMTDIEIKKIDSEIESIISNF